MKKSKLERSNRAHTRLQYQAVKNLYSPNINQQESMMWGKKYDYHTKVIQRQKGLKRVLTKAEKKKIWATATLGY